LLSVSFLDNEKRPVLSQPLLFSIQINL